MKINILQIKKTKPQECKNANSHTTMERLSTVAIKDIVQY